MDVETFRSEGRARAVHRLSLELCNEDLVRALVQHAMFAMWQYRNHRDYLRKTRSRENAMLYRVAGDQWRVRAYALGHALRSAIRDRDAVTPVRERRLFRMAWRKPTGAI